MEKRKKKTSEKQLLVQSKKTSNKIGGKTPHDIYHRIKSCSPCVKCKVLSLQLYHFTFNNGRARVPGSLHLCPLSLSAPSPLSKPNK